MARPAITAKDFALSTGKTFRVEAEFSTKDLVSFSMKRLPSDKIIAKIRQGINRANQRIMVDLKEALDSAIQSGVWAGLQGSADIYDTGALMQSGTVTMSGDGVTIAYSAPYAALVHYGGYLFPYGRTESRVYLPPRPWVDAVLNGNGPVPRFDFERYYREEIVASFKR